MQHITCSMDRISGGTTSPWHYTITWGIYCLQRWALQRSWRPGCPLSRKPASVGHTHPVPHSSTYLHQYPSTCLSTSSASPHNFGHWRNQGLFAPWDRVKNLVKLILYYSTQCYKSWGTVSLTDIYKTNNLNIHPGDLLKYHKSTETLQNSFAKTTYSDILSLLSLLSLNFIWPMSEHHQ